MLSSDRIKILLLIPHLGGGGAERVITALARNLDHDRYDIHLGLVTQSAKVAHDLPPFVSVHALGSRRVRYTAIKLRHLVWALRPALILSGMAHLNLMVLLLRPLLPIATRICVRQNGDLPATLDAFQISWLARRLYAIAYKRAHRVICQTPAMAADLSRQLGLDPQKLIVLLNPVDIDEIRATSSPTTTVHSSPNPRLVAIARLAPEKGLDLLLEAFAGLLRSHSNAELEILGSGPCLHALQAQCQALGIEDHVHFRGEVSHPARYFQGVGVFVLSSRHEGLPNALLEAAAAGIPIVALPASAGLVALVSSQPGVWLTKTICADALENALANALASIQPGQRFSHTWIEPFKLKRTIPAFQRMMDAVLNERAP